MVTCAVILDEQPRIHKAWNRMQGGWVRGSLAGATGFQAFSTPNLHYSLPTPNRAKAVEPRLLAF